ATTAAGSTRRWSGNSRRRWSRRTARRRSQIGRRLRPSRRQTQRQRRADFLARAIQRADAGGEASRRRIGADWVGAAFERRQQRAGERLAKLDSPLIERVDAEQDALDEGAVFEKCDQLPQ